MVKWRPVVAAAGVLGLSTVGVHAQIGAAAQLQIDGNKAMAGQDYATAAKDFDQIVTTYPSTPHIEDITIRAGYAYLHSNDYLKAINELQKLTLPAVAPEFRGKALFFTGLAQFSQAHKLTGAAGEEFYRSAGETLAALIDLINTKDAADKNDLLETAMYYQALSAYGQEKYDESAADLETMLKDFPTSLQKPDYLLLLGSVYAVQANDAINAKQTGPQVMAIAQKAIDAFDAVIADPNAKVQGNEANMREGEIFYLLAETEASYYQKALDGRRAAGEDRQAAGRPGHRARERRAGRRGHCLQFHRAHP
jgi:outer membrane protein assembly factor BamD (BamD/ComL family)